MLRLKRREAGAEPWLGAYLQHCKAFFIYFFIYEIAQCFSRKKKKRINKDREFTMRLRRKLWGVDGWWGGGRWQFRAIFLPVWELPPRRWLKRAPAVIIKEWFVPFTVHLCVSSMTVHTGHILYMAIYPRSNLPSMVERDFQPRWNLLFIGLTLVMAAA